MQGDFDPALNIKLLREGMVKLIRGELVGERSSKSKLIVVFDMEPSDFATGRIVLFQDLILRVAGFVPQILFQMPACIKVGFSLAAADDYAFNKLDALFRSDEFARIAENLYIKQVQYNLEMFHFYWGDGRDRFG